MGFYAHVPYTKRHNRGVLIPEPASIATDVSNLIGAAVMLALLAVIAFAWWG